VFVPEKILPPENVFVVPDELMLPEIIAEPEMVLVPDRIFPPENVFVVPEELMLPEMMLEPDKVFVEDRIVPPEAVRIPVTVKVLADPPPDMNIPPATVRGSPDEPVWNSFR
jgi:hypothetical protein